MKTKYKGCDIEANREKSLSGDELVFFSAFDDGFEVTSGYSEGEDTLESFMADLKDIVDYYRENPEDYE